MISSERSLAVIQDELDRIDCHEVALVRVVDGTAEFEREGERVCCRTARAVRVLFLLPHHAGDDAAWSALSRIQVPCDETHRGPKAT